MSVRQSPVSASEKWSPAFVVVTIVAGSGVNAFPFGRYGVERKVLRVSFVGTREPDNHGRRNPYAEVGRPWAVN